MPQRIPVNGKWVAPVKPQNANTGGDVFQLPSTGNPQVDQVLRQMADFMTATHRQTRQAIQQHAESIASVQSQAPKNLQKDLSTKGSSPLNITGLLGTPSVLAKIPVNNSGASTAVKALAYNSGDPGPQSLTAAKFKQITEPDGSVYWTLYFQ